jgi:hypothetical protein
MKIIMEAFIFYILNNKMDAWVINVDKKVFPLLIHAGRDPLVLGMPKGGEEPPSNMASRRHSPRR